jgi:hypothetical protein
MKTIADLRAKIREAAFIERPIDEGNPAAVKYSFQVSLHGQHPDELALVEEELLKALWDAVFAPRVGQGYTILWRREPGFQDLIPRGRRLDFRAVFVQEQTA